MRLWRVATAGRLAPFGDAIGDSFVFDTTLAAQQHALCRGAGLELVDVDGAGPLRVGPGLVLFDDCYVDARALALLQREGISGRRALGLGGDALGRFLTPLARPPQAGDDPVFAVGLFAIDCAVDADDGEQLRQHLAGSTHPVVLPLAGSEVERLPGFGPLQPTLTIPRAPAVACRIRHWVHVLWLNQVLAYGQALRTDADRRGNSIDPSARVHPTAWVERSRIGANAVVEPHATVIDTLLGADCQIADHTALLGCALGSGCQTLTDTHLRRVVAYPGSTISNMGGEETLIGRAAFVTAAAIFFTTVRGENARVDDGGCAIESGRPRLGSCVGHRSVLGARAIFAPAVALPNDCVVVMRPEEGVGLLDPALADGRPACWHQGALVPVERIAPGYRPPEID